ATRPLAVGAAAPRLGVGARPLHRAAPPPRGLGARALGAAALRLDLRPRPLALSRSGGIRPPLARPHAPCHRECGPTPRSGPAAARGASGRGRGVGRMFTNRLTTMIFVGMLLGILVGYLCNMLWPDPATAKAIAGYIGLMTDVFLRLIKMIIAPLVFSTLVVGVAHMGDTKAIGRIGLKAMGWFIAGSLVSL